MKNIEITLNTQELKNSLNKVKGGIENNSNHIILSYVLIEIENQILKLTTTNSEIEIKTTNSVKTTKNAKFTLCLIDINNIISKLDEGIDVNFNISEDKIIITTNKNKFELNTLKDYKFNKLIEKDEVIESFKINTKNLHKIINKTKFSIASDNPQKYLNSLFLSINKNEILTAASDGHRLSTAKNNQSNDVVNDKKAIIPKKTIDEIIKLLAETNDEFINISINENYIIVNTEDTKISSRLTSGEYPDYKQIFPTEFKNEISINKNNFEKALKQVEIFTKESKTIKLTFKSNNLTINTESEKGSAKSNLEIKNFDKEITINFNVSYLIQTLENLESENIIFKINDSDSKVVVLENDDSELCRYLIMSVKV